MPIPPVIYTALIVCLFILLATCDRQSQLERIKELGVIRVSILPSPAHYIVDNNVIYGTEYKLANGFAQQIGVRLNLVQADNIAQLNQLILQGKIHIGIPSIPLLEQDERIRNSITYNTVSWFLICRQCDNLPDKIDSITTHRLIIPKHSRQSLILQRIQKDRPNLQWIAHPTLDTVSILDQMDQHGYFYTLMDEDSFTYFRRIYPRLKKKMKLLTTPSSWALTESNDMSLYARVNHYLQQVDKGDDNDDFLQGEYKMGFFDKATFLRHVKTSLPKYRAYFEEAALKAAIDWRLLAAVSYQESHWDPQARSYTGVRGMMMLTRPIAAKFGIKDRLDPQASINGGAQYLRLIMDALPGHIDAPDRIWLALAAYNVGLGHLKDARILTQRNGQNQNKWDDVKDNLPLLSQKKWYQQTRHGYARGQEPVLFVKNIKEYYDMLRLYLLRNHYADLRRLDETIHPALMMHPAAL